MLDQRSLIALVGEVDFDIDDAFQAIREGRLRDALAYLDTAHDAMLEVLTSFANTK